MLNGAGSLALAAAESYSGGTTIDGGTLQLGYGSSDGSITGNVNDQGTLVDDDSGSHTLAGTISGAGSFVQVGTGTTVFDAAQAYTGGTTVDVGTLRLGTGASLASSGSLTVNGGTFDLNGNNQTIGDFSGTGGPITLGAGNLAAGTAHSTTFGGNISGSGSFVKVGAGTLTLTGGNSYSGGTFVESGTLQLGNGGASGSIVGDLFDNAIFALDLSDTVTLGSTISGGGAFDQLGSGTVIITATDTYSGGTTISAGTLELGTGGSLAGGVSFAGAATLRFDTGTNQLGGSIAGFAPGTSIDLAFLGFSSALSAVWQENGGNTGGTLLLVDNGSTVATLNLSGQYVSTNFSLSNDGHGDTAITFTNPSLPAGTTADMIMEQSSTGNLEIYDLGNNAILAAYALGNAAPNWQVAGLGGFFSTDTSDAMLRNSSTGALQVDDISNNTITNTAALGQVGLEWQVAGFGDFSSRAGETDMLMRNGNTGAFELYDIRNNAIYNATPMGQVGLEWSVAGFGDFSTQPNETDMLMRNSNTGAFELYDIRNNQITSAAPVGQVGLEWSVAGFGDFSGNANETDMLMRNSNTGVFELYDISNDRITSAAPVGQVGLEWSVVGFGPINGGGTSDMLMRNSNTGAFELYDISNNTITSAAPMGQVGLEWSVAGIAADALIWIGPGERPVRTGDGVFCAERRAAGCKWPDRRRHPDQPGESAHRRAGSVVTNFKRGTLRAPHGRADAARIGGCFAAAPNDSACAGGRDQKRRLRSLPTHPHSPTARCAR